MKNSFQKICFNCLMELARVITIAGSLPPFAEISKFKFELIYHFYLLKATPCIQYIERSAYFSYSPVWFFVKDWDDENNTIPKTLECIVNEYHIQSHRQESNLLPAVPHLQILPFVADVTVQELLIYSSYKPNINPNKPE